MTGKQSAVLWSGVLLIILRLTTTGQWPVLWGLVSTRQASNTSSANQSSANKSSGSQTLSV